MTGKVFGGARRSLGITENHMARVLGIHRWTLKAWEASLIDVSPERESRWKNAFNAIAGERSLRWQRDGYTEADIRQSALCLVDIVTDALEPIIA